AAWVAEHDVMHYVVLSFGTEKLPAVMAVLKRQNVLTKALRFGDRYELEASMPLAQKDRVMQLIVDLGVSSKSL
ncbi:MAG TPA: hypothetical protein VEY71_02320, partial [Chitinophagales bacterium]|nr:hypothetical protein [Chitinophagales bacterium]